MKIDEALNILEPKLLFPPEFNEAISVAKEAINQYRSIGTPEECQEAMEKKMEILNKSIDDFVEVVKTNIIDVFVSDSEYKMENSILDKISEQLKGGEVN